MNSPGRFSGRFAGHPQLLPDPDTAAAAVRQLREHLRRRPDDGPAWLALAQLLAGGLPGPELHHALEQAIQSNPESTDAWLLAAGVHRRQRGLDAALHWLAHWSRQNPDLTAPQVAAAALQAEAARQAGRWQDAVTFYREVEKSRPLDPALLNDIGSCLASLERFDDATAYFRAALQQRPRFPEAQLNLGLLLACQGRDDAALQHIAEVLEDDGIAADTRHGAQVLQAILREHGRLRRPLERAVRTGRVDDLQAALETTPALLAQPHADTVTRLRRVAERCRALAPAANGGPLGDSPETNPDAARRVEAAILCNLEGGAGQLQELDARLAAAAGAEPAEATEHRYRCVLRAIRDRDRHDCGQLCGAEGEAWLRYWHARLLATEPDKRPGQYKLSANAIKGLPLTPPEQVAGSLGLALRELSPTVPAGAARGLFLYVAVNMIHAFGDGNGRLARFLLAWETARTGARRLLVPVAARAPVAQALDVAWLEGEVAPLAAAISQATDRPLR
jgi:Flp pilus assembly protein TadD